MCLKDRYREEKMGETKIEIKTERERRRNYDEDLIEI